MVEPIVECKENFTYMGCQVSFQSKALFLATSIRNCQVKCCFFSRAFIVRYWIYRKLKICEGKWRLCMRFHEDWEVCQDSLTHIGRMLSKGGQELQWQSMMRGPKRMHRPPWMKRRTSLDAGNIPSLLKPIHLPSPWGGKPCHPSGSFDWTLLSPNIDDFSFHSCGPKCIGVSLSRP